MNSQCHLSVGNQHLGQTVAQHTCMLKPTWWNWIMYWIDVLMPFQMMTMPTCQKDAWSPWHEGWTDEERSPRLRDFEIMLKNLFPFAIFVPCRPVWSMDPNGPIFFIQMREDSPKESHGTNLEYAKRAISCHGGVCEKVKVIAYFLWCTEQYRPSQVLQNVKVGLFRRKQILKWCLRPDWCK